MSTVTFNPGFSPGAPGSRLVDIGSPNTSAPSAEPEDLSLESAESASQPVQAAQRATDSVTLSPEAQAVASEDSVATDDPVPASPPEEPDAAPRSAGRAAPTSAPPLDEPIDEEDESLGSAVNATVVNSTANSSGATDFRASRVGALIDAVV